MSEKQDFMGYVPLDGIVSEQTTGWDGQVSTVPPGDYLTKVVGMRWEKPSKNGNRQCSALLEVLDGEYAGRQFRSFYVFKGDPSTGKGAIRRLVAFLEAIGVPWKRPDGTFGFDGEACANQELVVSVHEEQYDGDVNPTTGTSEKKTRSKVDGERPRSEWGRIKEQQAKSA